MDIVQRLRLAAPDGLTSAHVSDLAVLREAADEIERLRDLVRCIVETEPDAPITSCGLTAIDDWRYRARRILDLD